MRIVHSAMMDGSGDGGGGDSADDGADLTALHVMRTKNGAWNSPNTPFARRSSKEMVTACDAPVADAVVVVDGKGGKNGGVGGRGGTAVVIIIIAVVSFSKWSHLSSLELEFAPPPSSSSR